MYIFRGGGSGNKFLTRVEHDVISGRSLDYPYDPKNHSGSYKIRRIEEQGKFNNTLLAAVESKCNIRFVLSVVQGRALSDTTVLFFT